jgi:glycosyltransferase involved in cell wall biosynthesis
MLLPALREHLDVEVNPPAARRPLPAIYQLGNNPHHEWIYRAAMQQPGVIVLHDVVLHHLIVEMTLARGDVEGYVAAMAANHGEVGAAWARGRAAGLHSEMGNFLLPASIDVANRSRAVIVHNRYAAERLRSFGVRTPIHVVPHPYEPHPEVRSRGEELRARHGFAAENRVVGFFGFLTAAKRSEIVLQAFREARQRYENLRLLVVGEAAPNVDTLPFSEEGITFTGYVPDDDFNAYFAAADRLVNLRYPSAGETSGTLVRAFEAGKPIAVSDYAQFAELPEECAVKIPFGKGEIASLVDFFLRDLTDPSDAQRRWLHDNARMELTVKGYLEALRDPGSSAGSQPAGSPAPSRQVAGGPAAKVAALPLFPKLEIVSATSTALTLRNVGDATLRTRLYGEPGYRLIVNGRWIELPGDLPPGETAVIDLPQALRGHAVAMVHAIQGIPMLEAEVWGRATFQ